MLGSSHSPVGVQEKYFGCPNVSTVDQAAPDAAAVDRSTISSDGQICDDKTRITKRQNIHSDSSGDYSCGPRLYHGSSFSAYSRAMSEFCSRFSHCFHSLRSIASRRRKLYSEPAPRQNSNQRRVFAIPVVCAPDLLHHHQNCKYAFLVSALTTTDGVAEPEATDVGWLNQASCLCDWQKL
ncbi:hypothetical protein BKA81DRAFT_398062 [Phyllosticta paracitricarpa]